MSSINVQGEADQSGSVEHLWLDPWTDQSRIKINLDQNSKSTRDFQAIPANISKDPSLVCQYDYLS